ncbi:MAG: UDP-glucose 4-epimerase GalE [Nanoarchaeota archaeon]
MRVLVTGGAGYIGSFAVKSLLDKGHKVTVFDSLENGHKKAVDKRAKLVIGNLNDTKKISDAIKGHDAVMHFAGYIDVAESMRNPKKYYENNLANGTNLLNAMVDNKVSKIVFSSTAAVYGNPEKTPITENSPTKPINHYGASKLMFEKALQVYENIGINSVALRYFNVAGAAPDASLGENHEPETHLIPKILFAAKKGEPINVFGNDYPTKDGTCIRDYIHVQDLIDAHLLALDYLVKNKKSEVFNLGNQKGFSVLEVIKACEKAVGKKIKIKYNARRPGDPPVLIASSEKIRSVLGWKPEHDINSIAKTAWLWHRK